MRPCVWIFFDGLTIRLALRNIGVKLKMGAGGFLSAVTHRSLSTTTEPRFAPREKMSFG
jgi:hypothetical protein